MFIAAAGFGYYCYKNEKPMPLNTGVSGIDIVNHVGAPSHSEQYDDGTSMMQYEMVEDKVFKILDARYSNPGYPKRIKIYKTYTLTLFFDANGNSTSYAIKESPNSPLLGQKEE